MVLIRLVSVLNLLYFYINTLLLLLLLYNTKTERIARIMELTNPYVSLLPQYSFQHMMFSHAIQFQYCLSNLITHATFIGMLRKLFSVLTGSAIYVFSKQSRAAYITAADGGPLVVPQCCIV